MVPEAGRSSTRRGLKLRARNGSMGETFNRDIQEVTYGVLPETRHSKTWCDMCHVKFAHKFIVFNAPCPNRFKSFSLCRFTLLSIRGDCDAMDNNAGGFQIYAPLLQTSGLFRKLPILFRKLPILFRKLPILFRFVCFVSFRKLP